MKLYRNATYEQINKSNIFNACTHGSFPIGLISNWVLF